MIHALIWMAMHSRNWQHVRLSPPIGMQIRLISYIRYTRQIDLHIALFTRPAVSIPGSLWIEYAEAHPGLSTNYDDLPF